MNRFGILPLDAALQSAASSFDCGSSPVYNHFIKGSTALDPSYGKTFILVVDYNIVGYYNISAGDVEIHTAGTTTKCGGAVHINFLAVDKKYRGVVAYQSESLSLLWSDLLLIDCLKRVDTLRTNEIGIAFVTLTSSSDGMSLYRRFGFDVMEEDMSFSATDEEKSGKGTMMYLPLGVK